MRTVTFIANGKEYKTYAEARAASKYVETKLSKDYDAGYTKGRNIREFGNFTGKLAEDWVAPYRKR